MASIAADAVNSSERPKAGRFPGLDGDRAIAMTMVMLLHVHASTNGASGVAGVDGLSFLAGTTTDFVVLCFATFVAAVRFPLSGVGQMWRR